MNRFDILGHVSPFSFLLIYLIAKPGEPLSSIFLKIIILSIPSFLIFSYLGFSYLKRHSILPSIPYVSISIISLTAIPVGLMIFGYSSDFVLSVVLDPVTIVFSSFIFVFLFGFIEWGIELGKKVYLRNNQNPLNKRTKKIWRKKRELYPKIE